MQRGVGGCTPGSGNRVRRRVQEGRKVGVGRKGGFCACPAPPSQHRWPDGRAPPTVLTRGPGVLQGKVSKERVREEGSESASEREARGRERGKEVRRKQRSVGTRSGRGGKRRSKVGAGPGSARLLTWALEAGKRAGGKRRCVG